MARVRPGGEVIEHRPDAVVRPVDVRLDDVVEAVAALVAVTVRASEPACGDQSVDRAELALRARHRPLDPAALPDVARLDASRPVERGRGLVEALAPAREERQRGAVARKPQGDGASDARPRPRHHHMLSVQPVSRRSQFAAFLSSDPLARVRARA